MYQHGFQTQHKEIAIDALPVSGTIPTWLNGTLLRTGPAQFEFGDNGYRHWFDGLAMLHRFSFDAGTVSYSNKFLQSPEYKRNNETGKISYSTFATDPCRSIFRRVMSVFRPNGSGHNGNVNLAKLGEQFIAMTETPLPVAFDAQTLETAGVVEFADDIDFVSSTAHPHFDPQRNAGVQHLIDYGRTSAYKFAYIPNEQPLRRDVISKYTVSEPAYVHSFGITDRFLILAEFPLVVNPLKILLSGKPFIENFVWKPERGTRFLVFEKHSGALVREISAEPCFAFHHINAFEDGDDIVLDMSTYDDHRIIEQLFLDRLRSEDGGQLSKPEFRRYRLPTSGDPAKPATFEVMSEFGLDLPRINYAKYNGKPYRYAYGGSFQQRGSFIDALVKVDIQSRQSVQWFEDGAFPGEPVFVPAPDAAAEDDGVILSVVLDGKANTSYLLVLDAQSFAEIGRTTLPQHIPFGFHGQYFN